MVLVCFLDQFFRVIDELCSREGVEKTKTTEDCYMCVACEEGASRWVGCAQQVQPASCLGQDQGKGVAFEFGRPRGFG